MNERSQAAVIAFLSVTLLGLTAPADVGAQDVVITIPARALAALQLPYGANALRSAGVPAEEVRTVFVEVRRNEVPAPEVVTILDHSVDYVYVNGPVPRFGHYVGVRLGEGYRGRRLYRHMRGHYREHGHRPPGHVRGHRRWHPRHGRFKHRRGHGPRGHGRHGLRGKHRGRARGHGGRGRGRVRGGRHRGGRAHGGGRGRGRVRGGGGRGGGRARGGGGRGGGRARGGGGRGGGGRAGGGGGRGGGGRGRGR